MNYPKNRYHFLTITSYEEWMFHSVPLFTTFPNQANEHLENMISEIIEWLPISFDYNNKFETWFCVSSV